MPVLKVHSQSIYSHISQQKYFCALCLIIAMLNKIFKYKVIDL